MRIGKCQNKVHLACIIGTVPRIGDVTYWSRVMSNGVEFLRKDATFVSEVRSPTGRRRELGALLRRLRTEKGLTVEQAADRLLFSMSKLSRMETGHGVATRRDIRDLCDLYGVTDEAERDHLMNLAVEGRQQGWWQSYDLGLCWLDVGLEAEAVAILWGFQLSSVVHGLAVHCGLCARRPRGRHPQTQPEIDGTAGSRRSSPGNAP